MAPVVTTTSVCASDDKVGIISTLHFQCYHSKARYGAGVSNRNLKILANKLQTVYDTIPFATSIIRIILISSSTQTSHHTIHQSHSHICPNLTNSRRSVVDFLSNTYHTNHWESIHIATLWTDTNLFWWRHCLTVTWHCHAVTLPWARVGASTSTAANNANTGMRILTENKKRYCQSLVYVERVHILMASRKDGLSPVSH